MGSLKCLIYLIIVFVFGSLYSQVKNPILDFKKKYDSILVSNNINSKKNIYKLSREGDSTWFMHICYVINANNIMYKATKEIKYLYHNKEIIDNIFLTGYRSEGYLRWTAKSKQKRFKKVYSKEVILYEGYLLRYICEYSYILFKTSINKNSFEKLSIDIKTLENIFFKWYRASLAKYNDDSELQSIRTHMGSHWAVISMYLYKLSINQKNKEVYKRTYENYNSALLHNLKITSIDDSNCYIWNSTWDIPFTNLLRERKRGNMNKIQDVSHGNQVVEYIISSYELKLNNWTKDDLFMLSNTLKYKILKGFKLQTPDNIDGSFFFDHSIAPKGWKQSDGWMKLMSYDKELFKIYQEFYTKYKYLIDTSNLNLQFYSNFVYNYKS